METVCDRLKRLIKLRNKAKECSAHPRIQERIQGLIAIVTKVHLENGFKKVTEANKKAAVAMRVFNEAKK